MIIKLEDDFKANGQSFKEFSNLLEDLDSMSYLKTLKSEETEILSYIKEENGYLFFSVLPATDNLRAMIADRRPIKQLKFRTELFEDKLLAEAKRLGLMFKIKNEIYLTSENLMRTLSQRMRLGDSIFDPSLERDAYMARIFGKKPFIMNALVRASNNTKKMYAVFSNRYIREEQSEMLERMKLLQFEKRFGPVECKGWEVSNFKTIISFDLTDKSNLGFSPGITYCTSDTGTASSKVCGYISYGNKQISLPEYGVPHRKGYSFFEEIEGFEERVVEDIDQAMSGLNHISSTPYNSSLLDCLASGMGKKPKARLKQIFDGQKGVSGLKACESIIRFIESVSDFGDVNSRNVLNNIGTYLMKEGGNAYGKAVV